MEVIFHIGMPKCASSSLQAHFANNDAFYEKHGFLYPSQHRLKKGYQHHNPLFEPSLDQDKAAKDILEEADSKGCDRILISTEQFSTDVTGQLAVTTSAFAREIGADQISCLCLIRDPVSMLRSGYHQFVRAGLWRINRSDFYANTDGSIQSYITAFRNTCGFEWYEYEKIIRRTTKGVGAKVLNVWDIHDGQDLITRLTSYFDLPMGVPAENKNPRLPQAQIKFLRYFQQEFGQQAYSQNRMPLLRKINLSETAYSTKDALHDGIDITNSELQSRFPDMQHHFEKALSLDGMQLTPQNS